MNKSILFNISLIISCTLLTVLPEANAENLPEPQNKKEIFFAKHKLLEINQDTLHQMKLDEDKDTVLDKYDQCPNSPLGNDVDKYGCTKYVTIEQNEEAVTISLLVNFENDKYTIDDKYFHEISLVANFLKRYKNTSLIIEGHTSSLGGAKYNKKLSQKRANEIMKMLINDFSISQERLSALGYGEEQLIDLSDTQKGHAINRRIIGRLSTSE